MKIIKVVKFYVPACPVFADPVIFAARLFQAVTISILTLD